MNLYKSELDPDYPPVDEAERKRMIEARNLLASGATPASLLKPTAFDDIRAELLRARAKYPDFHSSHEGHSLIREELEELWDLVKADKGTRPSATYTTGLRTYRSDMRAEAVQIAAMAIRFIEDLCDDPPSVGGEGAEGG